MNCHICQRPIPPTALVWRHRHTREIACSQTCREMPESLVGAGGGDAWELVAASDIGRATRAA